MTLYKELASGNARCRNCNENIPKGILCLSQARANSWVIYHYHLNCVPR
jgi:hypothetical protein